MSNIESAIESAEILRGIEARTAEMIDLRRDLHRHPELSFQEHRTAAIVAERLKASNLDEVTTGVGKTGVVGVIKGGKPGKTLLLRADMDALPILEDVDVSYKSTTDGVMHACGHDGHVAIALAVASLLAEKREHLAGTIKFAFQPAEEIVGGAKPMIDDGVMVGVDAAIGLHLGNDIPTGLLGLRAGPAMANVDNIEIKVKGKGGHGSQPEKGVDSIAAAAYVITTIQTIVSREITPLEPAVVTFGTIHGGFVSNVIAPEVILTGTVRSFNKEVREHMIRRIEEIATGVARSMRCELSFDVTYSCPAVVNDKFMTDFVRQSARRIMDEKNVLETPPIMGADDMALFLNAAPGCYFFVGSAPENAQAYPHHHPRFDINEQSLVFGARAMARAAFDFLGE